MSRWLIERSGTGIEKSGTGVEKTGSGIERSGTGVEKSGTGVEKTGSGISSRGRLLAFVVASTASVVLATGVSASQSSQESYPGALTVVSSQHGIAVSWIFDGSVFSGVAPNLGSVNEVLLTEIGLARHAPDVARERHVAGGGSGASKEVAGGGSGSSKLVAGGGSGSAVQVAGGGSGSSTAEDTAQSRPNVAGGGSGSSSLIAGGGSGRESITITLPEGTGLRMEVAMGCNSATVTLLDSDSVEIAVFENQPVIGSAAATYCTDMGSGPGLRQPGFGAEPEFGSGWEMR